MFTNPDHIAFEEWSDGARNLFDLPGPYAEKADPFRCIICGAPYVTCKGEDHGIDTATDPQGSLDHYAEVFGAADREASERLAGIREGVRRDLDPGGDEFFIPFE